MKQEYAVILSFESGEVFIIPYDSNIIYGDYYEWINEKHGLNLNESNSSYMITSELNIEFL